MQEMIDKAIEMFKNRQSVDIEPDLRGLVYTTAMVHGDTDVYDALKDLQDC